MALAITMLRALKHLIPAPILGRILPAYHFTLAFLAAARYGFPSRRMILVGVTGTKGKTTTCALIAQIFAAQGHAVGMATTVNFKIREREWVNDTKQTMLGRFGLQRLLARMAKAGCTHAVIETSSEGILQYRHRFIDYDAAVFTNLTPEHLERHGGFDKYCEAKLKLFERVARKSHGIGVYNLDDDNVSHFLAPAIKEKYGYTLEPALLQERVRADAITTVRVTDIELKNDSSSFVVNKESYRTPLVGKFNVANAAAALATALAFGIPTETIKRALSRAAPPPGRMEQLHTAMGFTVVIDYAHEPASLEAAYRAIRDAGIMRPRAKLICLLGAQGGGRDAWKRKEMGKRAGQACDAIVLTNEDPYDENPLRIISGVKDGVIESQFPAANLFIVPDRREGIRKALSLAARGDAVALTGKGGEVWMCVANGKKIPWDERRVVDEELRVLRERRTS